MFFVKRKCYCCAETYHLQKEVFLFCVTLAFFEYSNTRTQPFDQGALGSACGKAFYRGHASGVLPQAIHLHLASGASGEEEHERPISTC